MAALITAMKIPTPTAAAAFGPLEVRARSTPARGKSSTLRAQSSASSVTVRGRPSSCRRGRSTVLVRGGAAGAAGRRGGGGGGSGGWAAGAAARAGAAVGGGDGG